MTCPMKECFAKWQSFFYQNHNYPVDAIMNSTKTPGGEQILNQRRFVALYSPRASNFYVIEDRSFPATFKGLSFGGVGES